MARNFAHGGYVVQTTLPYKKKKTNKKQKKTLQHNEMSNFRNLNEKIISDSVENSHHFLNIVVYSGMGNHKYQKTSNNYFGIWSSKIEEAQGCWTAANSLATARTKCLV